MCPGCGQKLVDYITQQLSPNRLWLDGAGAVCLMCGAIFIVRAEAVWPATPEELRELEPHDQEALAEMSATVQGQKPEGDA